MRLEAEAERLGISPNDTKRLSNLWKNKLRPPKDKNITREQLVERWKEQAERIGMDLNNIPQNNTKFENGKIYEFKDITGARDKHGNTQIHKVEGKYIRPGA